ncbi:MAG: DUF4397 domain-containing protein [Peptostreptococcaceae bacterium]
MDCFKIDQTKNLVRMFNALPENVSVDIYVNGELLYSNVKYKEFTTYAYGEVGNIKIDVYNTGTKSNPLIRGTVRIPAEQIFTIALTGNKGEEALLVLEDDITQQPSKESAINKIVNLSPDLPEADVNFNDTPSASNISYRDETLYAYLPPGKYKITVEESETEYEVTEGVFEFKAERIYTIYIIGNPPNVELIQSVDGNTYACL